jgi:hypothetical protein
MHNPFDLVNYARQTLAYMSPERIAASPVGQTQLSVFVDALTAAVARVEALADENLQRNSERREELASARGQGVAFEKVLVAYRQCLRALLGKKHPDVRVLSKTPGRPRARSAHVGFRGSLGPDEACATTRRA